MKPKEIQELLDFIANSGLAEVNIETEQFKLAVKRNSDAPVNIAPTVLHQLPQTLSTNQVAQSNATTPASTEKVAEAKNDKLITIKSPMIGTFYRSANPESPSFANIGDDITKGKVICIIEAMKLFNEIESEYDGKIVKMLVENATPVEFDQPLFVIEVK